MHVNGAPQMMQPPNMGVVPGPMPVPGQGQGPVPVGPPGDCQIARTPLLSVKLCSFAKATSLNHELLLLSSLNTH